MHTGPMQQLDCFAIGPCLQGDSLACDSMDKENENLHASYPLAML